MQRAVLAVTTRGVFLEGVARERQAGDQERVSRWGKRRRREGCHPQESLESEAPWGPGFGGWRESSK